MLGGSIEFASTESAALHAFGDMYSHNPGGIVNFAIMLRGWGGVGWGGALTFTFTCAHRISYIMISSLEAPAHTFDATL